MLPKLRSQKEVDYFNEHYGTIKCWKEPIDKTIINWYLREEKVLHLYKHEAISTKYYIGPIGPVGPADYQKRPIDPIEFPITYLKEVTTDDGKTHKLAIFGTVSKGTVTATGDRDWTDEDETHSVAFRSLSSYFN
jgi:hypothetical protein